MADCAATDAVVFVLEPNPAEREEMQRVIGGLGCAVAVIPGIDAALLLLRNQARCDMILLDTDAMDGRAGRFDELVAARQPLPVILYGVDPGARIALHCLNGGAVDFLTKPLSAAELTHAVGRIAGHDAEAAAATRPVVASSHVAGWIEVTASSELEQFRRLQRFSDALFASRVPMQACEDLKMAVEEVGRNAVEWGNRFDPDKRVHVSYCIFSDRVVVKVEDEGDGFTPKNVPDPTLNPMKTMQDRIRAGKRPGGYGVYLIRKLVDDIVYNEKGNTVLLIKRLP